MLHCLLQGGGDASVAIHGRAGPDPNLSQRYKPRPLHRVLRELVVIGPATPSGQGEAAPKDVQGEGIRERGRDVFLEAAVKELLEAGADPNLEDTEAPYLVPLSLALETRRVAVLEAILDPPAHCVPADCTSGGHLHQTVRGYIKATESKNAQAEAFYRRGLDLLLYPGGRQRGADIDGVVEGQTALDVALAAKCLDASVALLRAGASYPSLVLHRVLQEAEHAVERARQRGERHDFPLKIAEEFLEQEKYRSQLDLAGVWGGKPLMEIAFETKEKTPPLMSCASIKETFTERWFCI